MTQCLHIFHIYVSKYLHHFAVNPVYFQMSIKSIEQSAPVAFLFAEMEFANLFREKELAAFVFIHRYSFLLFWAVGFAYGMCICFPQSTECEYNTETNKSVVV